MADNSLEMKLTADFSDALTKTTVMNVEVKNLSAQVNKLSKQYLKAADSEKAILAPELQAKIQEYHEMQEAARTMANGIANAAEKTDASVHEVGKAVKEEEAEELGFLSKIHERVRVTGESFEDLHAKISVFSNAFASFNELIMAAMGGEFILDQIEKVAEMGEALGQLQEKTGATAQELAVLRLSARENNVAFDTLEKGLINLGKNMQEAIIDPSGAAAQDFSLMGVKIRNTATGQLLPVATVFDAIAKKMAEYQAGTAKTDLATTLFGEHVGSDLIPVLGDVGQHTKDLTKNAQQLGLVISEKDITASENFESSQKKLKISLSGVREEMAVPLMNALTDVAQGLLTNVKGGNNLASICTPLEAALGTVVEVVVAVGTVLGDVIGLVNSTIEAFKALGTEADALGDILSGDLSEGLATAKAGVDEYTDAWARLGNTFMENEKIFNNVDNSLFYGAPAVGGDDDKPGAKQTAQQQAPQPVDLGDWYQGQEATLGMSNAAAEKGAKTVQQAQEMVYQNTVNYWQKLLAGGKLNAQQRVQVEEALANAEVALKQSQIEVSSAADKAGVASARQAAQSQVEILQAQLEEQQRVVRAQLQSQISVAGSNIQIAQAELQTKKAGWNAEVAAGQMTADKEAQLEANLQKKIEDMQLERVNLQISAQNKIYNAELDGYQKELSMMPKNSAAYAKMLDNIIVLKADEVGKISALDAEIVEIQQTGAQRILQANLEAAQRTQEAWREALRPLDTYFTQSLNGILQGTETLQDVELSAARNITLSFVDMEAKKLLNALATDGAMVAHQLATQTRLTAATEAGETTRLATKEAANATGKSISLASGMAEINSDAMKAAAGAYASVSEIPVVGPFLAPAAGAAAYAAVMGYEVLSAEGGMTIPANVNPLTQLHEKEMVLPAYIAQPLMDMVMDGRSFSNQTTQTTGGDTHHVTVNNNMSANGIGAADFAHNVLQALDNSVRGGQINSGKYRALARALRRG